MSSSARFFLLQAAALGLAILFGALAGSVILLAIDQNPLQIYALMVRFNLTRVDSIAAIFYRATPLILAGLATALAFRAMLFNIGVEGQYYVGAIAAAFVGFAVRGLPAVVHLPLTVLTGMLAGALWSLLPIALKLRRGAHEVITTIMMNAIAGALVLYLLEPGLLRDPAQAGTPRVRTPDILPTALMPLLHSALRAIGLEIPPSSRLNWFLPLGAALCVFFWWVLRRWRFGFEVRAVAHNPGAAEAAGISTQRIQFLTFLLSGAVAGLVGLPDTLAFFGYFDIDFPKGYGFLGISIALLAKNNPLGVVAAALFIAFLDRGAQGVQVFAGAPREVITILQGLIILAIVVGYELLTRYIRVQRKREAQVSPPLAPALAAGGTGEGGQ
jgi:simple sugar transport system permease protein